MSATGGCTSGGVQESWFDPRIKILETKKERQERAGKKAPTRREELHIGPIKRLFLSQKETTTKSSGIGTGFPGLGGRNNKNGAEGDNPGDGAEKDKRRTNRAERQKGFSRKEIEGQIV